MSELTPTPPPPETAEQLPPNIFKMIDGVGAADGLCGQVRQKDIQEIEDLPITDFEKLWNQATSLGEGNTAEVKEIKIDGKEFVLKKALNSIAVPELLTEAVALTAMDWSGIKFYTDNQGHGGLLMPKVPGQNYQEALTDHRLWAGRAKREGSKKAIKKRSNKTRNDLAAFGALQILKAHQHGVSIRDIKPDQFVTSPIDSQTYLKHKALSVDFNQAKIFPFDLLEITNIMKEVWKTDPTKATTEQKDTITTKIFAAYGLDKGKTRLSPHLTMSRDRLTDKIRNITTSLGESTKTITQLYKLTTELVVEQQLHYVYDWEAFLKTLTSTGLDVHDSRVVKIQQILQNEKTYLTNLKQTGLSRENLHPKHRETWLDESIAPLLGSSMATDHELLQSLPS